jgi:hypothetical protein
MATRKKKPEVTLGYMLKVWVEIHVQADGLAGALEQVNVKRKLEDFLTIDDGVEVLDYSVEPVQVTQHDRITVND